MILSDISIRRPVLATMLNAAVLLLGLIALLRLPVRELPDVDPPIVNVRAVFSGASAQVVETEVTEKIEEAVNGVEGVKLITSESRDQVSNITVEFELSRDIDLATQDVRDRVTRIREDLPDDIDEPVIFKQESDARPILWIALFSDPSSPRKYSTLELSDIGERILKDPLETVEGVSSVILGGEKRFAVRIRLDPKRMAAHGVTVIDVAETLRTQNVELPSGTIENLDRELILETQGELKSPEEFNDLVIARHSDRLVRLREIGTAEAGVEDEHSVARYNSQPAMGLGIVRQSKANTIRVAEGIKEELERIRPLIPPGIATFVAYDESIYIDEAISEVWITLGIAFLLVVVTIFVFLRSPRATLVPTITIPIATIAAFAVLSYFGYSINILTMLALVLAIGLVVDDSIVVLENIHRHIENGASPMAASFAAMREIAFAVIATTVALVAVLFPLVYQRSVTGRLFIEFAVTLCGAVIVSTFVALTLTPSLSARILKPVSDEKPGRLFTIFERFFDWISARYEALLKVSLRFQWLVLFLALASLGLGMYCYVLLPKEFLPQEDKGRLFNVLLAPEGATAEYTDRMLAKMETMMQSVPEAAGFFSAVALPFDGPGKRNQGIMFARFKAERSRRLQDIVNAPGGLQQRYFGGIEGALAFRIMPKAIDRGFGQPFQLVLQHQDLQKLAAVAEQISQELRQAGFLANVRANFEFNKPQLDILVDRARAAILGVSVADIARTTQLLFGSEDLSSIKVRGKEYEVIAQLIRDARMTPQQLDTVYVRSSSGALIQLSNLINYKETPGPNAIFHHKRLRAAIIEATPQNVPLGETIDRTEAILAASLPEGFRFDWKGEADSLRESNEDAVFVILLALIVIYMVLAAQFESFVHPLTVMVALPLAVVGAFGSLLLLSWVDTWGTHFWQIVNFSPSPTAMQKLGATLVPRIPSMTLNLFSQIGVVLLLGLVTKNSILLVDFANQAMVRGASATEAILEAGKLRLRPILMTAFATIAGILPIAIGFGAGAESRRPMGVVAVGGMLTSTLLTLFVVPVIYVLFDKVRRTKPKQSEEGTP